MSCYCCLSPCCVMLLLSSERRQPVYVQCQAGCCLHPWQLKIPTQSTLSPADAPVWEWSPHWKFPPACWESSLPRTGLSWLTWRTTAVSCNDGKLVVGFKTGLKGRWFWSWSGLSFHPPIPSVPIWRQVGSRLMEHLWEQSSRVGLLAWGKSAGMFLVLEWRGVGVDLCAPFLWLL